jgi:glycosyltransferase involved in cell wall biosynthesis
MNSQMKITLVSRFFDPRNGGVGSVSKNTLDGLEQVKVLEIKTISQELKHKQISNLDNLKYFLFCLFGVKLKTWNANSKIYHALSPMESIGLPKNKTVVTIHDLILLQHPNLLYNGIMSKFSKVFYKLAIKQAIKCKKIIAISNETKLQLIENYSLASEKITVIRDVLDNRFFDVSGVVKNEGVYRVGTISKLLKQKRIDLLIKAFLKADIKNSELVIAGAGNDENRLKELAKGDSRIKFLGFISDDEVIEFYKSLDVFVFPTLIEGYGMPIVEAMACSIPVITLNDALIPQDLKSRTINCSTGELDQVLSSLALYSDQGVGNDTATGVNLRTENAVAGPDPATENKIDLNGNLEFAKLHSKEKVIEQLLEVYSRI